MPAFIPPLLGLTGLLIALGIFRVVLSYPEGNPEVKKIGDMIHSGAMSFMKTEYMYLVVFVLVLAKTRTKTTKYIYSVFIKLIAPE